MLLRFKLSLFVFLCFAVLFSCKHQTEIKQITTLKFNKVVNAQNFKLIQHPNFIELQIIDPEKGHVERSFALIREGVDLGTKIEMEHIEVPVKGLVCLSATQVGMLNKLKAISFIKGIVSKKYVSNKQLLNNLSLGKVQELQTIDQLNPERVLSTGSRVVMYDGFGTIPTNEEKLKKLGVVCIPDYDWRETDPLGKAEWIKLLGVLVGKELLANNYFTKISNDYSRLKKQAKQLNNHQTILSGSLIGDLWYMPAGESFYAHMLSDAQLDYQEKDSKGTGSVSFSLEHCLKVHKQAKLWINPGVASYTALLRLNPKYQFLDVFQHKKIYCYSHNANYFWENSAIEPHHLLSDLIALNHGEGSIKKLYFYRKLEE